MTEHSNKDTDTSPARDDSDPNALPLETARRRILDSLRAVSGTQTLALLDARGRIAARVVQAAAAVPPFRASAMDGYAIRLGDAGHTRIVSHDSLAGHPSPDRLTSGRCHRIMTGARVPDDADTVVQQEDVTRNGDQIVINEWPSRGLNVRDAGSAGAAGSRLIDVGDALNSAALAVLAAHGIAEVDVFRRLRVGLLSTGDELVEPGAALGNGQIHDANRILLATLLDAPTVQTVDLGIVIDTPEALRQRLADTDGIDVLVTSGGVSVGDADHVRDVLGEHGQVDLWKIAMKPGRPLAFGRYGNDQLWFGLPGNPVSAAVTSLFIVRPALHILAGGHAPAWPMSTIATLDQTVGKRPGRVEFQRGHCTLDEDGDLHVVPVGAQDSHVLRSLQLGNCLIELPSASSGARAGETVSLLRYEEFGLPAL